jgi:nucleotide-binding universal stress UspA family protein
MAATWQGPRRGTEPSQAKLIGMKAKQQSPARGTDNSPVGQIVVGTDFSIHASEAVNAAAAIARRLRIPLLLAHVLDDTAFLGVTGKSRAQARASAQQKLGHEASRLRDRDVEVCTELLEGRPEVELARLAARPESRLIVTASLGLRMPPA